MEDLPPTPPAAANAPVLPPPAEPGGHASGGGLIAKLVILVVGAFLVVFTPDFIAAARSEDGRLRLKTKLFGGRVMVFRSPNGGDEARDLPLIRARLAGLARVALVPGRGLVIVGPGREVERGQDITRRLWQNWPGYLAFRVCAAGSTAFEPGSVPLSMALASVAADTDQNGVRGLTLHLAGPAVGPFAYLTASHVGRTLAILLNGRVIASPVITGPIRGGTARIQFPAGNMPPELRDLAGEVSTAPLSAEYRPVANEEVGPSWRDPLGGGE